MEDNRSINNFHRNKLDWRHIFIFWTVVIGVFIVLLPLVGGGGESIGVWLFAGFIFATPAILLVIALSLILKIAINNFIDSFNKYNFIISFFSVCVVLVFLLIIFWRVLLSDYDPAYQIIIYPWFLLPLIFALFCNFSLRFLNTKVPKIWEFDLSQILISTSLCLTISAILISVIYEL